MGNGGSGTKRGGAALSHAVKTAKTGRQPTPKAHLHFFAQGEKDLGSRASAEIRAAARNLLGRTPTNAQWAGLVGARSGDHVSVSASQFEYRAGHGPEWYINVNLIGKRGSYGVEGGYGAHRGISRDEQGHAFIYNQKFYVDKSVQGQGIGTTVLTRQAETAHQMGISYLLTNPMNPAADHTWQQMGYYRWTSPQGESYMRFDTAPGSQSRRTLAAYQAERANRVHTGRSGRSTAQLQEEIHRREATA